MGLGLALLWKELFDTVKSFTKVRLSIASNSSMLDSVRFSIIGLLG